MHHSFPGITVGQDVVGHSCSWGLRSLCKCSLIRGYLALCICNCFWNSGLTLMLPLLILTCSSCASSYPPYSSLLIEFPHRSFLLCGSLLWTAQTVLCPIWPGTSSRSGWDSETSSVISHLLVFIPLCNPPPLSVGEPGDLLLTNRTWQRWRMSLQWLGFIWLWLLFS